MLQTISVYGNIGNLRHVLVDLMNSLHDDDFSSSYWDAAQYWTVRVFGVVLISCDT